MEKNKKFFKVLICLTFLLLIYNPNKIYAKNPFKNRVLSLLKGAYVLYEPSSYSFKWKARNLIDGLNIRGWRSKKDNPFPHIIVFGLAGNASIDLLKFNNNTQENNYFGISAKEVQVEYSTLNPDSGYISVGTFTLKKSIKFQEYKIQKTKARWIRLTIKNNYGHHSYTELTEFEAWGIFEFKILQIISNFIWILGIAIILATLSYHEFLINLQKTKRAEVIKRGSFRKPFLLGIIFIATGIIVSIQQPWLAGIAGIFTILLIIWYIKFIITQAVDKQEDID